MRIFIGAVLACLAFGAWAEPADPAKLKTQLQDYYFDAARRGDLDMLNTFIDSGYSLNTQDDKGYTALILAAYHGQGPFVERLLNAGADACVQDKRGNTALMGAIFKGELKSPNACWPPPATPTNATVPGRRRPCTPGCSSASNCSMRSRPRAPT